MDMRNGPVLNNVLWDKLKKHIGHRVSLVCYGDEDDPNDVCLECEDCGCVVLDSGVYTIIPREDIWESG